MFPEKDTFSRETFHCISWHVPGIRDPSIPAAPGGDRGKGLHDLPARQKFFRGERSMKKIAVLVSGSGSNLQSIIDSAESGYIDIQVSVVVSNKENAYGLVRAQNHGIPTQVIKHSDYPTREDFENRLIGVLDGYAIDLVVLAGFMRVLTPLFVNHYHRRIMNIHPALLPSFPGTHGQKQALDYGVRFSGCTTHFVDEGTDTGPIIIQAVVPVLPGDTEESLGARILKEEHRIYPESLKLWSEGRLVIEGRKVRILPDKAGTEIT